MATLVGWLQNFMEMFSTSNKNDAWDELKKARRLELAGGSSQQKL